MRRRGLSIVEALLAVALLASSLVVVLPLLRSAAGGEADGAGNSEAGTTSRTARADVEQAFETSMPSLTPGQAARLSEGAIDVALDGAAGSVQVRGSGAAAGDRAGAWVVRTGDESLVVLWRALPVDREASDGEATP